MADVAEWVWDPFSLINSPLICNPVFYFDGDGLVVGMCEQSLTLHISLMNQNQEKDWRIQIYGTINSMMTVGLPWWKWKKKWNWKSLIWIESQIKTGLPRVGEKSGKNKIFSRSGNCQGILKKCQGILAIWPMSGKCQGILSWQLNFSKND